MSDKNSKKQKGGKPANKQKSDDKPEENQGLVQSLIDYKGWNTIFQYLLGFIIVWTAFSLYQVYIYHTSPEFMGVRKYPIEDFQESLFFAAVFAVYKYITDKIFTPFFYARLDTTKYVTALEKNERTVKCVGWMQSIIYYSFTTLLNLYLFRDQFFFATWIGGSGNGECANLYSYLPYGPDIPNARRFYMFQLGGHIYSTLYELRYKRHDKNFYEMILHHGMTIFLIVFSYLTNNIPVGIIVLYTHDPGDVFLALVRLYNDMKDKIKPLLYVFYGLFVFIWAYFRMISFPVCTIWPALKVVFESDINFIRPCYAYLTFMLCGLVLLHYYWFLIILKILLNLFEKKSEPNMYDKKKIQ